MRHSPSSAERAASGTSARAAANAKTDMKRLYHPAGEISFFYPGVVTDPATSKMRRLLQRREHRVEAPSRLRAQRRDHETASGQAAERDGADERANPGLDRRGGVLPRRAARPRARARDRGLAGGGGGG